MRQRENIHSDTFRYTLFHLCEEHSTLFTRPCCAELCIISPLQHSPNQTGWHCQVMCPRAKPGDIWVYLGEGGASSGWKLGILFTVPHCPKEVLQE